MKQVKLYTDGACRGNPGNGGYGSILEYTDAGGNLHQKELSAGYRQTTNNRMELLAVIKGLQELKKPCQVTVFSDSKYIVDAFAQGWVDSWLKNNWKRGKKEPVKNQDLWQELLTLMEKHQVEYEWVRGHNGHPQNERCDLLATTAADGQNLLEDIFQPES
ncbi:ribonuclease HI [Clostridiales bacterium COT073_COT-073]|nr:ribonuclease HI [Clostridiales bacterium COT073_COT-073]